MAKVIVSYDVKNWKEFQHYGKRNPPWIKLHRAILDDDDFNTLAESQRLHLILLWLHASQNNGKIKNNSDYLERKLDIKNLDLNALAEAGFLIPIFKD